ncbi:hypothetical protein [Paracoccus sp. (in: a-proteobacteria)]
MVPVSPAAINRSVSARASWPLWKPVAVLKPKGSTHQFATHIV